MSDEYSPEYLKDWLFAKYDRHGELEDLKSAQLIDRLTSQLVSVTKERDEERTHWIDADQLKEDAYKELQQQELSTAFYADKARALETRLGKVVEGIRIIDSLIETGEVYTARKQCEITFAHATEQEAAAVDSQFRDRSEDGPVCPDCSPLGKNHNPDCRFHPNNDPAVPDRQYQLCFSEREVAKLGTPDIASYAYPPKSRKRYTPAGWQKMFDADLV